MLGSRQAWLAVAAAALTQIPAARADTFDVRPITIETRDGSGSVVISNPGDRRIYLETQVLEWTQDANGQEHLVESETAIASPPATWVSARSSYTMRVRLPSPSPTTERAFRVVIKQLPERADIASGRVVFALTQNIPAFFGAEGQAAPILSARLAGRQSLVIQNGGGRRVRITHLAQDGRELASGLIGYALAGGALSVALAQTVHPGTLEIETDLGPRHVTLH